MADNYFLLADVIAAESLSPEHLRRIALETRRERDELREFVRGLTPHAPDFACRCGECQPFPEYPSLCKFTRLPIPQSR